VQLGILFWFYKDAEVSQNRIRMLRRRNPELPIYGLYGGQPEDAARFSRALGGLLDDFWSFPRAKDSRWKWRNGDLVLSSWFTERGRQLEWDSVFLAQWDTLVCAPIRRILPPLAPGEMLVSGLRPVSEVEGWWQWMLGDAKKEYDAFRLHLAARYGAVDDPKCCQFIVMVLPRRFFEGYSSIEEPELGFLEYKVPMYAQAFGVPLVEDTCFRPWWPEEPATAGAKRTASLMHAWRTPVRLPVVLFERFRPGGRRVFHPYHGIYPHDFASLAALLRRLRESRAPEMAKSIASSTA
jgi:hypothetical protein